MVQPLDEDIQAALKRFMAERPEFRTTGEAGRYLLRDALIGLGLLPLGEGNRSRGAVQSRGNGVPPPAAMEEIFGRHPEADWKPVIRKGRGKWWIKPDSET